MLWHPDSFLWVLPFVKLLLCFYVHQNQMAPSQHLDTEELVDLERPLCLGDSHFQDLKTSASLGRIILGFISWIVLEKDAGYCGTTMLGTEGALGLLPWKCLMESGVSAFLLQRTIVWEISTICSAILWGIKSAAGRKSPTTSFAGTALKSQRIYMTLTFCNKILYVQWADVICKGCSLYYPSRHGSSALDTSLKAFILGWANSSVGQMLSLLALVHKSSP